MFKTFAVVFVAAIASGAFSAETPRAAWIKAKCAVCHGEDGAGNTPEGKRRKVPDLRSEEIQKHTDAELYDMISAGHGKMPSFKTQISKQQIALLVTYIRSLRAR
jgi:mono/diheme cytochrome c family protein